jgi:Lrp/AsnC family leucine-responsive transcriptional regulator
METPAIDFIDRDILGVLRSEGRISFRDLAERIGLGASATTERVRRLEQQGVIRGYGAVLDLAALGIGLMAVVELKLDHTTDPEAFEQLLASTVEVTSAVHVTGAYDYLLDVACADVETLDRLLRGWKRHDGVLESSTRIVLNRIQLR